MAERFYQMVMLIRDGEGKLAWLDQSLVQEGNMIEMVDLPEPRNLWTIRHVSQHIIPESRYKEILGIKDQQK